MKGTRRGTVSIAVLLLTTGVAAAQAIPAGVRSEPVDIAVTYDALHTNHITGQSFWMQGGAVEMGARMYRGLGIAARVEGDHAGTSSTDGEPLSLVTALFGLRYTMETHSDRYAVFCESMGGISNGFNSLFSKGSGPVSSVNAGTTSSANAYAFDFGGGVDVRLSQHLAIRAIRASYLRTQFPNSTTNVQNNLSLGAGLVFRFGQ